MVQIWDDFEACSDDFGQISGHLPGFCPLLKMNLARKNPVFMRVCGGSAHFPTFFFYLIVIKKLNIIYNRQKKVGFWPETRKAKILTKVKSKNNIGRGKLREISKNGIMFQFFIFYVILNMRHNFIYVLIKGIILVKSVFSLYLYLN